MNKNILSLTRVFLGFIFLWAFFDKLFGLGFATTKAQAWINGGSPTSGFLSYATKGPLMSFFQSLSGSHIVDTVFMAGLLFVGITLMVNRFVKWGSIAGLVMMILMYLAVLLPVNNPILDEHIMYALIFLALIYQKPITSLNK